MTHHPQPQTAPPAQQTAAQAPISLKEAARVCAALADALSAENEAIRKNDTAFIEKNLPSKEKLAARVARILGDLKGRPDIQETWQASTDITTRQHFKRQLQRYEALAKENILLLRGAHEANATFLNIVAQAVEQKRPKSGVYGKSGQIEGQNAKPGSGNMVRTEI